MWELPDLSDAEASSPGRWKRAWELPDSDQGDQGDDGPLATAGGHAAPRRRVARRTRRGRPVGYAGTAAARAHRDAALASAGLLGDSADAPEEEENEKGDCAAQSPPRFGLWLSCLPSGVSAAVAKAACRSSVPRDPELTEKVVPHFFGPISAPIASTTASAHIVGMPRRNVPQRLAQLAAAIYWASQAWTSSLVSWLRARIASRAAFVPVADFQCTQIDETPLLHKGQYNDMGPKRGARQELARVRQPVFRRRMNKKETQAMKEVQVRCEQVWLFECPAAKRTQCWVVPLITPLQVVDHGTGETLAQVLDAHWGVNGLASLRQLFGFLFDAYTADRALENGRCFNGRAAKSGIECLIEPCFAHIAHAIQSRSWRSMDYVASGLIAYSLCMKPGGAVQKLRRYIAIWLWERVRVVDDAAPSLDAPSRAPLVALLDLCLPGKAVADIRRRHELLFLFTSDITSPEIVWRCPGLLWDKWDWAVRAAFALLPSKARLVFGIHDVGHYAVTKWCRSKLADPAGFQQGAEPRSTWQLSSSSDDERPDSGAAREPDPKRDGQPGIDWAAFNRKQRKKCEVFAPIRPAGLLVVACATMAPTVELTHYIEHMGGKGWFLKQMAEVMRTGSCTTRMSEVSDGRAETRFLHRTDNLLWDTSKWPALEFHDRTRVMANVAFSMISATKCTSRSLLFRRWAGFPCKLWGLLSCGPQDRQALAHELLHSPKCLLDPWSEHFLKKYSTVPLLTGSEALGVLHVVGLLVKIDNCFIECLNALLRRLQREKSQTHCPDIAAASAEFVIRQQAIQEKEVISRSRALRPPENTRPEGSRPPRCKVIRTGHQAGHKTHGGGVWRRALGVELAGTTWKTRGEQKAVMRAAHQSAREKRAAGGEVWQQMQEEGRAGTLAHRCGGKSFGGAMPKALEPQQATGQLTQRQVVAIELHRRAEKDCHDVCRQKALARQADAHAAARTEQAIVEWCESHREEAVPLGSEALPVDFIFWCPPAREMAERALAGQSSSGHASILGALGSAWQARHNCLVHSASPPLPGRDPAEQKARQRSICALAGQCLCSDDCRSGRCLAQAASIIFRKTFVKDSAARKVYDENMAVLHVFEKESGWEDDPGAGTWLHCGHGDLRSGEFHFTELVADCDSEQALSLEGMAPRIIALK
ncbi:unnamed protein product, partial [Prorocentrum cordatum]